jgi:DNA-directed RNA polymerase subunit M/transcription elongation factor TFIIS
METTFCNNCDNLFHIYHNEEKELYYGCKTCGLKTKLTNDKDRKVYENIDTIDSSKIFNTNQFLLFDNTLPKIKSNKNIQCPNQECSKGDISYICYNIQSMDYMYICQSCGQKWKNKI